MNWSERSFRRTCWLFFLELFLHSGDARVNTEAPAGPLYRVVGSLLSISCNTSGFSDNRTNKEFEFRITMPSNPTEINIISTHDRLFSYAVYSQRVRNKEITLTHVTPNSAVFEIHSLQRSDEGEFECYVKNPEVVYDGVYNAKTTVRVIDDSLTVSSPAPPLLSYDEDDPLTLTCRASSNTAQHTHLSLTWYLQRSGEDHPRPIISLDRDLTLVPGQGFEGRYQAGLIRLDKVGEGMYRLTFGKLEKTDQGEIHCQAQEWIQDPDGTWYSIAQKEAEKKALSVKAREVLPATSSLLVRMSAQPKVLQEGQELSLSCSLDTQNIQEKFFSVAWIRGGVELARIGPSGILTVGSEYSARADDGELQAVRRGVRDYDVVLQPVRAEDQGEYVCRVWPQVRGQDGRFTQEGAQDSDPEYVTISASDGVFSLEMSNSSTVKEGDSLSLTCKVNGGQGRLSVAWQRRPASSATASSTALVGLDQDGVLDRGAELSGRTVRAARPAADTFTLEVDGVTPSDAGVYLCVVSEWKTNSKVISQSYSSTVTVAPTESFLKVRLLGRNNRVTVGDAVELICQVKELNAPMALTWTLQRDGSPLDAIVTAYSDGSISWSGAQRRYQLKVERKGADVLHYLLVNGASRAEAGSYRCSASVFRDGVYRKLPQSNQVAVTVERPVSRLELTSAWTVAGNVNADVELKCSVLKASSPSSRYSVTWRLQRDGGNETVVSSDRDALVTFGPQVEPGPKRRVGAMRSEGPTFTLSIRRAQASDGGSYVCEVVEWLPDPLDNWYPLPPLSRAILLTLTGPKNDLQVKPNDPSPSAKEGEDVELGCDIISGASGPSFFYNVSWIYAGGGLSGGGGVLAELDHTGLLKYPENPGLGGLRRRLRLSRPAPTSSRLGIGNVQEEDEGSYTCQVHLYHMDNKDGWQYKASQSSAPITLSVRGPGADLVLAQEEAEVNVSASLDFTVLCHIVRRSSVDSELQVTWFRQDGLAGAKRRPVFTAYRNSTLRAFEKSDRLRYRHPSPNSYSLTVSKAASEDAGVYFCEVEEWLPSLAKGWRKVAKETSGYLSVHVHSSGDAEANKSVNRNLIWVIIALVMCIILLSVVFGLILKRQRASGKKTEQCLWSEKVSMKSKPCMDD